MNLQRISAIFKMDIRRTLRQPAMLFLVILFPLVLTAAFGLAFGSIGTGESTYDIAIINLDGTPGPWAQSLISNVSENEVFNVIGYPDNASAQADLVQGNIDAVLVIPANFSESCDSYWADPTNSSAWLNVTIELYVDSGSLITTQAVPPIIQQIILVTLFGESASATTPIGIGSPSLVAASKLSQFDWMVPGLFAYGSIFLTMTAAQSLVEEKEKGLLRRIYVTPTSSSEFVMSHGASNMVFATMQVGIIFVVASLLGFTPAVGVESYVMVFAIALVFALCNVGFGLIIAGLSKNSGSATGLAFIFILPQMFLGTFVPVPEAVAQFVPSYYFTDAITTVFLRGAPISSPTVLFDLLVLILISIGAFLVGMLVFKKYGKT